jgi:hypothetical protein
VLRIDWSCGRPATAIDWSRTERRVSCDIARDVRRSRYSGKVAIM